MRRRALFLALALLILLPGAAHAQQAFDGDWFGQVEMDDAGPVRVHLQLKQAGTDDLVGGIAVDEGRYTVIEDGFVRRGGQVITFRVPSKTRLDDQMVFVGRIVENGDAISFVFNRLLGTEIGDVKRLRVTRTPPER